MGFQLSGKRKGRVVVGMSGGVDSAVTAALLHNDGYEVIGITMQIWPDDQAVPESGKTKGCCGMSAVEDARRVANTLGFRHYVLNFKESFDAAVIQDFVAEYQAGRTPNPCVRCNQFIKFDHLLQKARDVGAEKIATGHYAKITQDTVSGRYRLLKANDAHKDQSYVLYVFTQNRMAHTLLPLGNHTKDEVRQIAEKFNLCVAQKPESQEICFVPTGHYSEFVKKQAPDAFRPGPLVDLSGSVLGEHSGIGNYTIGQRKRLGVTFGEPRYVTGIDAESATVTIGTIEQLNKSECLVTRVNWLSGTAPSESFGADIKIRYNSTPVAAMIIPDGAKSARVVFDSPQRAVTPGQAAVWYRGDEVIGGGTIT